MKKEKFEFLANYNPKIGGQLLTESENRFLLIGYIRNSDVQYAKGDYYILVDTTYPQSDNIKQWFERAVIYNSKEDGSGTNIYPYNELKKYIQLLPEYKGSYYEYAIFGESKEMKEQKSKELFSTIEQKSGNAVLKHNTSKTITDGYVRVGMPYNSYSKSDFQNDDTPRAYFWGSQGGKDVSNFHTVNTYICVLPINEIYDIENNINGWNIKQAIENGFSAVAYYVNGNKADGTVVAVFKSLPIVSSR